MREIWRHVPDAWLEIYHGFRDGFRSLGCALLAIVVYPVLIVVSPLVAVVQAKRQRARYLNNRKFW